MDAYEAAFAERTRYERLLAERGYEVWGAGIDMTTMEWDVSVDDRDGRSVTLRGAEEVAAFLAGRPRPN